ncbi:DNApol-delta [Symbiodinium sp. CCMP2592]|nr:DNApol-delta [Symbiodinium sp. CCMP2592]
MCRADAVRAYDMQIASADLFYQQYYMSLPVQIGGPSPAAATPTVSMEANPITGEGFPHLPRRPATGEYAARQAHVELAERLRKADPAHAPKVGERVPYVFVAKGNGANACDRAEDPLKALEAGLPLDAGYYLDHQLKQPLLRVFEPVLGGSKSSVEHTLFGASGSSAKVPLRKAKIAPNAGGSGDLSPLCLEGSGNTLCKKCASDPQRTSEVEKSGMQAEIEQTFVQAITRIHNFFVEKLAVEMSVGKPGVRRHPCIDTDRGRRRHRRRRVRLDSPGSHLAVEMRVGRFGVLSEVFAESCRRWSLELILKRPQKSLWALYCEVILLACLVASNRERQKTSVLKINEHLVARKYGVDEDKLFQPLLALTKPLME